MATGSDDRHVSFVITLMTVKSDKAIAYRLFLHFFVLNYKSLWIYTEFYHIIMSVELILSHREVALDPYNRATLNIKASFSSQPSGIFALFKVLPLLERSGLTLKIRSM